MFTPVEVEPLPGPRIWIRYGDGTEGAVDLAHLAGRGGFALWDDDAQFEKVRVAEDDAIRWTDEVERCPDATHLKLTGQTPEEAFSRRKAAGDHA